MSLITRCTAWCAAAGLLLTAWPSAASGYTALTELKRFPVFPEVGSSYGAEMDIDGDRVIVGGSPVLPVEVAIRERNHGGSDGWGTVALLEDTSGTASEAFGSSVALSGDWAAVGDTGGAGSTPGNVFLFYRNQGGPDNWGLVKVLDNPNWPAASSFSYVAMDGDILAVGAAGTLAPVRLYGRNEGGPDNWGFVKELATQPDWSSSNYGQALDIDCDQIIVGAIAYITNGIQSGAAFVYERNEGGADNWGLVQRLYPNDPEMLDWFGSDVAIHGDHAVVGASFNAEGEAYVFERNQGGEDNWGQVAKLLPDDSGNLDYFGYSVDVFNDYALVGAYAGSNGALVAGSAFLFKRNEGGSGAWGQIRKFVPETSSSNQRYGQQVALAASHIVVGAPRDDAAGINAGAVFVYPNYCYNFSPVKQINPPLPQTGAEYGISSDIWGTVAAIGEHRYQTGTTTNGRVHIHYQNDGGVGQWDDFKTVQPSTAVAPAVTNFGRAVALWNDTLVAGARADSLGNTDAGVAYVFSRNAGGADNWGESAVLLPQSGELDDDMDFGASVDIHCDTIVVGAPGTQVDGYDVAGKAYVFYRNAGGTNDSWAQAAVLESDTPTNYAYFGEAVAVFGDLIAVGEPSRRVGNTLGAGTVHVFKRNEGGTDQWGRVAQLTMSQPTNQAKFGEALALYGKTLAVGVPGSLSTVNEAYVFEADGSDTNWVEAAMLEQPEAFSDALYFGLAIDIWEDTVVIGQHGVTTTDGILVYSRNEGGTDAWGLSAVLRPYGTNTLGSSSLAIHGRRIVHAQRFGKYAGLTSGYGVILEPNCIEVTTHFDVVNGDDVTSLREAINIANTNGLDDCILLNTGAYVTLTLGNNDNANIGGDYDIWDSGRLSIKGRGADRTEVNGNQFDRVFHVLTNAVVTFSDLTIQNGLGPPAPIQPRYGGGIASQSTVTLYRVSVTNNATADGTAGVIGGSGGGIRSRGSLYIYDSTIADNATGDGDGVNLAIQAPRGGHGGGIFADGTELLIRKSTISGNIAGNGGVNVGTGAGGDGGDGGGLYVDILNARIEHSTIVNNLSGSVGPGLISGNNGDGGGVRVILDIIPDHTIFSDNYSSGVGDAVNGNVRDSSYCIFDDTVGITWLGSTNGNIVASANLAPLADNGGPTRTHEPLSISPAIDAGDPGFVFDGIRDQRGVLREPNASVDIGAVEVTEDFDSDTIPDAWEMGNGMDYENPGDAFIDADFDDFNGIGEYIANTDPFNPADRLSMLTIFDDGGVTRFRFFSKTGRNYQIEGAADPSGSWFNYGAPLVGVGGTQTVGIVFVGTNQMVRLRAIVP